MANLDRVLSCWPPISGLAKFGVPILASLRHQPESPIKAFNIKSHKDDATLNPIFGSTAPRTPHSRRKSAVPSASSWIGTAPAVSPPAGMAVRVIGRGAAAVGVRAVIADCRLVSMAHYRATSDSGPAVGAALPRVCPSRAASRGQQPMPLPPSRCSNRKHRGPGLKQT